MADVMEIVRIVHHIMVIVMGDGIMEKVMFVAANLVGIKVEEVCHN